MTQLRSKAGMFAKFLDGMDQEFKNLNSIRNGYGQELQDLRPFQNEIRADLEKLKEGASHTAASLERMKGTHSKLASESGESVKSLTEVNAYLTERLKEKVGMLSEERDRHMAFDRQLKGLQAQQKSVHDLFGEFTDKIINKLGGLESLIDQNKPNDELLRLVKRLSEESGTLVQQGDGSVRSFAEVKALLSDLSTA